jgi:hypothetical protein
VDFVVALNGNITQHIKTFHEDMRGWMQSRDPELAELVGELMPARMEDRLPLQVADVFCWHLRRQRDGFDDGAQSLFYKRGFSHEWTKDDLRATVDGVVQFG